MIEQVTIFGANGAVGREVVAEALARGYQVVAFVHRRSQLEASPQLRIVQGDVYKPEDVDAALEGSDSVISALGSWGTPTKDVLTVGMRHIISGMRRHGVRRIVSLTGSEARASGDHLGLIHHVMHVLLGVVASKVLRDSEQHIAQLESSNLDWTVIRSPIMSSRPAQTTGYRLTMKRSLPWSTVSRHHVVLALLDTLHDRTWKQKAPFVA
ncbi:MAG: NAD(P)H-binding protein [Candidatus Saccharimonadales bacterium]